MVPACIVFLAQFSLNTLEKAEVLNFLLVDCNYSNNVIYDFELSNNVASFFVGNAPPNHKNIVNIFKSFN